MRELMANNAKRMQIYFFIFAFVPNRKYSRNLHLTVNEIHLHYNFYPLPVKS